MKTFFFLVVPIMTIAGLLGFVNGKNMRDERLRQVAIVESCIDYQVNMYGDILGEADNQDGYEILKQSKSLISECVAEGGPPE